MEIKFKNKEYCFEELQKAREMMGDKRVTVEQRHLLGRGLATMYFYCPNEIQEFVLSVLQENERRIMFLEFGI